MRCLLTRSSSWSTCANHTPCADAVHAGTDAFWPAAFSHQAIACAESSAGSAGRMLLDSWKTRGGTFHAAASAKLNELQRPGISVRW